MKRMIVMLLAGVMLLSLAACSGTTSEPKPPAEPSSSTGSPAQNDDIKYPDGELRIQVPFKTGGAIDVQVRTTAKYLAEELGANVIVENTVGAGGVLGTTEYLQEQANTSTLLLTDPWLLSVLPMMQEVQYTADDFIPIIDHNSGGQFCLFASPAKTGINNFDDLASYGAQNRVLFGSGGPGTSLHVVQKSILSAMGLECDTITQTSTAEGLTNLIAGTVDISMSSFDSAADYVRSGEIVPILWIGGEETYSDDDVYASGVPSAKELGVDVVFNSFHYYSIRKGSDPAIVTKLQDAFAAVYANPDFIAETETIGFAPAGIKTEEIEAKMQTLMEMATSSFVLD